MADEPAKHDDNAAAPAAENTEYGHGDVPTTNGVTTFHLKVYSPFKTYYDGDVESVSAINDTGPFDILARHKNFMTLINPCDLIIRNGKFEEKVAVNRGIIHVKADRVIVFLDV